MLWVILVAALCKQHYAQIAADDECTSLLQVSVGLDQTRGLFTDAASQPNPTEQAVVSIPKTATLGIPPSHMWLALTSLSGSTKPVDMGSWPKSIVIGVVIGIVTCFLCLLCCVWESCGGVKGAEDKAKAEAKESEEYGRDVIHAHTTSSNRLVLSFTTATIHFLVVECRCIYAFYISFKTTMASTVMFVYSHKILLREVWQDAISNATTDDRLRKNMTMAAYTTCMKRDVQNVMSALATDYKGECLHITDNHWGKMSLSMEALVFVMIIVQVILLFRYLAKCYSRNEPCTFWSGRYISYTWILSSSIYYKVLAYTIAIYAGAMTILTIIAILAKSRGWADGMAFLQTNAAPLIMMVVSTFLLLQSHTPAFAKNSDTFQKLLFNRHCLDMFTQTSDAFAQKFEHALYKAALREETELRGLVVYQSLGFKCFNAPEQQKLMDMLSYKPKKATGEPVLTTEDPTEGTITLSSKLNTGRRAM